MTLYLLNLADMVSTLVGLACGMVNIGLAVIPLQIKKESVQMKQRNKRRDLKVGAYR